MLFIDEETEAQRGHSLPQPHLPGVEELRLATCPNWFQKWEPTHLHHPDCLLVLAQTPPHSTMLRASHSFVSFAVVVAVCLLFAFLF